MSALLLATSTITTVDQAMPTHRGEVRTPFRPIPQGNYFETPLTYDHFVIGLSDYDVMPDQIMCPCDSLLSFEGGVGEALREIDAHCLEAGHPMPVRSETL